MDSPFSELGKFAFDIVAYNFTKQLQNKNPQKDITSLEVEKATITLNQTSTPNTDHAILKGIKQPDTQYAPCFFV
jgi:hypothetical protein